MNILIVVYTNWLLIDLVLTNKTNFNKKKANRSPLLAGKSSKFMYIHFLLLSHLILYHPLRRCVDRSLLLFRHLLPLLLFTNQASIRLVY